MRPRSTRTPTCAARYCAFPELRRGLDLQALAREEIGGTPRTTAPRVRSSGARSTGLGRSPARVYPLPHLVEHAETRSCANQRDESGRLFRLIRAFNPRAPVTEYVGRWAHSKEFHASARLPLALVELGLIRLDETIPEPDRITRGTATGRRDPLHGRLVRSAA